MSKDLIHFEGSWCSRQNVLSLAGRQSRAQHLPLAWRLSVWCAMHGCIDGGSALEICGGSSPRPWRRLRAMLLHLAAPPVIAVMQAADVGRAMA